MHLTDKEKKIYDGGHGEAAAMAMSILVDLGRAIGAPEMVKISHVHTDSGFYLGDAGLEFVEHLAQLGGRVVVSTSMNNTSHDIENSASYKVPLELAAKIRRMEQAHLKMGAQPSWTCAPYQDGILPRLGEMVAWSESNAIVYANSILGARTNRTGDLVDICCALTGRAPRYGLYLDENRMAKTHLVLEGIPEDVFRDPRFAPLLGYYIGSTFGDKVVAVSGVMPTITLDDLKGLGAAAASSGATALFHLVGITPEAIQLGTCLQSGAGTETHSVGLKEIWQAEQLLCTAEDERIDWVGLGCPHFSKAEFLELIKSMGGKKVHSNVRFTVFTSRKIQEWARIEGIVAKLSEAGVEVYSDGCLLLFPNYLQSTGNMITNSVKAANYIYSQAGFKAHYGSIEDCITAAETGMFRRSSSIWQK